VSAVRIVADTGRCIGAGQCVLTAADLFDQDENGIVELLTDGVVSGDDVARVREAEHLCPAAALTVAPDTDGTTGPPGQQGV
jgi:ferredoxin